MLSLRKDQLKTKTCRLYIRMNYFFFSRIFFLYLFIYFYRIVSCYFSSFGERCRPAASFYNELSVVIFLQKICRSFFYFIIFAIFAFMCVLETAV